MSTITAPVGKSNTQEENTPRITESSPNNDENSTVNLKLMRSCKALAAGRIKKLEIRSIPTIFMASTIVTAVKRISIWFILLLLIPSILANSSSKVTEIKS